MTLSPEAEERFDAFAAERGPALVRLAAGLCGDWHLGNDLAQEALARAYLAWGRVERAENPDAYVRRILVNSRRSGLRRNRVREVLTDEHPQSVADDHAGGVAERDALLGALRELPAGQRTAVVLRYVEDLGEAEVAALMGVTPGTVKSQCAKGLARLRALQSQQTGTPTHDTEARR